MPTLICLMVRKKIILYERCIVYINIHVCICVYIKCIYVHSVTHISVSFLSVSPYRQGKIIYTEVVLYQKWGPDAHTTPLSSCVPHAAVNPDSLMGFTHTEFLNTGLSSVTYHSRYSSP